MRNGHLVLGVDPGLGGAIAGIWTEPPEPGWNSYMRPPAWVVAMPHVFNYCGKRTSELDVKTICLMFQMQARELGDPQRIHLMMEQTWPYPGSNPVAIGGLMRSAALIEGAAIAHGVHVAHVPPSVWKAWYPELTIETERIPVTATKQERARARDQRNRKKKLAALDLARKLWPEIDLSKAKDEGKAEALLIARYAMREIA